MEYVIEMNHITKQFGNFKANDDITLQVKKGEIHALLGENGAGKSTLMSVLFGLYQPEEGEIRINGKTVNINNPNDANDLGIGMVHQHFKLVHNFTAVSYTHLDVYKRQGRDCAGQVSAVFPDVCRFFAQTGITSQNNRRPQF